MTLSVWPVRSSSLGWPDLPGRVRGLVEADLRSTVVRTLRQPAEFDGGLVARLELADGRWVYLKALPVDSPRVGNYHAERAVAQRLPSAAPVPGLLSIVDDEWLVLVYSDIPGTRPRLRPGSPDLSAVLTTMGALARTLTPCPINGVPAAIDDLGPLLRGWTALRSAPPADLDPWALRNLDSLVAMETAWHPWAAGNTLLHNDMSPDNLVIAGPGRALVINWRYPARGAAWLDLVSLVPHIVAAGHEPSTVDRLIRRRPALHGVPLWAVTGYVVALTGNVERSSRLPEPPATTGVRPRQRALAEAGRRWIAHRTRWA